MENYKRLTNNNKDEYDVEIDFCSSCQYHGEPNGCNRPNGECDNYDRFCEIYNRLTELEDMIEEGTLIRKKCKVGDKLYFNTFKKGESVGIQGHKVKAIQVRYYVGNKDYGTLTAIDGDDIGCDVFLTKEEADEYYGRN